MSEILACVWELPPLILHPFADRGAAERIETAVRAAGVMSAERFLPRPDDALSQRMLECRYSEFRMLCFIGKDVSRWLDQCMDFVGRTPELNNKGLSRESFAVMLVDDPPAAVDAKLKSWGVNDYRSIFVRALGLQAVFPHAPEMQIVCEGFLRNYQRYAEYMFVCFHQLESYSRATSHEFSFQLYASGEYSRLLEQQWTGQMTDKP